MDPEVPVGQVVGVPRDVADVQDREPIGGVLTGREAGGIDAPLLELLRLRSKKLTPATVAVGRPTALPLADTVRCPTFAPLCPSIVVRHAHAGRAVRLATATTGSARSRRSESSSRRPSLASLSPAGPERILSSPAVRCMQTVEPLAARLGLHVEPTTASTRAPTDDDVRSLLVELAAATAVLCSHGDVIPVILHQLIDGGMQPDQRPAVGEGLDLGDRVDSPAGGATASYRPAPAV